MRVILLPMKFPAFFDELKRFLSMWNIGQITEAHLVKFELKFYLHLLFEEEIG